MSWGRQPPPQERVPPYGTDLYVGPKGAGKSLLAIHRALLFHDGKRRLANGWCVCGEAECDATWDVFTNLTSPTQEQFGAWAKPLDIAAQMMDSESNIRHVILLIDEITQYFNSRRSMMTEIVSMINRVTLIRKNLVQLWGTGISFDWLDVRIRDQASVVYNCWTPNNGDIVFAKVHRLALGHLPPERRRQSPKRKMWYTSSTKGRYNHEETINFASELAALRTEPVVFIEDDAGNKQEVPFSDILLEEVAQLIEHNITKTDAQMLVDIVESKYQIKMAVAYVRDYLIGSGFLRQDDGSFIIMTKGPSYASVS